MNTREDPAFRCIHIVGFTTPVNDGPDERKPRMEAFEKRRKKRPDGAWTIPPGFASPYHNAHLEG